MMLVSKGRRNYLGRKTTYLCQNTALYLVFKNRGHQEWLDDVVCVVIVPMNETGFMDVSYQVIRIPFSTAEAERPFSRRGPLTFCCGRALGTPRNLVYSCLFQDNPDMINCKQDQKELFSTEGHL